MRGRARHIRRLVIAGVQTDGCINATCRRAHELGYEVTLVRDARSTYADRELTASQIIARYNAELGKQLALKEAKDVAFG